MKTDHCRFILVNGIEGFVSKSKHQWFENGKWYGYPSTFISLNAAGYGYAGPEGKLPSKDDKDDFAKAYFILQRLIDDGILYAPKLGDDAATLWHIFWYTKEPM